MFKDLTLITCSYGTPEITTTMLKSFVSVHGDGPHNLLLMENSTNEDTVKLLKDNNIGYIRNAGFTHSEGVDLALGMCKTRYALLVDTDIIFKKDIEPLLNCMKDNDATLMGIICADRGGYYLKNRVHPWFCFINVEHVRSRNIRFYDEKDERIHNTKSDIFYKNIPLKLDNDTSIRYYDVGSTFFEDITKFNLKIVNANGIEKYFEHYEGSSWHLKSGHDGLITYGTQMRSKYEIETESIKNIIIKDKFNKKSPVISFIQPVFAIDEHFLNVNKRSLESLIEYLKHNDHSNVKFYFGGYCNKEEYWDILIPLINQIPNASVVKFDKNYGKAYVVNTLYRNLALDCDYIFTLDSDIVFDLECKDMFNKLVESALLFNTKSKYEFGMFGLDQHEGCCHWHNDFTNKIVTNGHEFVWSPNNVGIAGGCLFINKKAFDKANGYRIMGIYSGDDGFLLVDIIQNGYAAVVIKDIYIIHPEQPQNEKHLKWKHDSLTRTTTMQCKYEDELALYEREFGNG